MPFEDKFKQQISDFQRYGTYTYEYDEVGNVVLNPSSKEFSQVYLSLPIQNYIYDDSKVKNFYDPVFTEFVPPISINSSTEDVGSIQSKLADSEAKNIELNKKLDSLIEENESIPSSAEKQATKQVILELRKELGQGRVDSDFSEDFPYSAIQRPSSIVEHS